MLVNIDKSTGRVVGLNLPTDPLHTDIEVPDDFNISKVITIQDGEIQKVTDDGMPLYRKASEEVTISREPIAWEDREIPNMVLVDEVITGDDGESIPTGNQILVQDGTRVVSVESEWIDYEPIMIDNIVERTIRFSHDISQFTLADIIDAGYLPPKSMGDTIREQANTITQLELALTDVYEQLLLIQGGGAVNG